MQSHVRGVRAEDFQRAGGSDREMNGTSRERDRTIEGGMVAPVGRIVARVNKVRGREVWGAE